MIEAGAQAGYRLELSETADKPRRKALHSLIRHFNESVSPQHQEVHKPGRIRPLCIYLVAPDGEMAGGLASDTYWDWWEIDDLWLREDLRGQGYGQRMMLLAEEEARRRGCHHAAVHTFSFQAPGFYLKLGYRVIGQLDDFPPGATFYWLRKDLD